MLLLLWVRVTRWYSTAECWVSWVETVKCVGQQYETWRERGPGSTCPAPTLMRVFPLTIKCRFTTDHRAEWKIALFLYAVYLLFQHKPSTSKIPKFYLKFQPNWRLITYLMYLFVISVSLWQGPNHKTRMGLGFGVMIAKHQQIHLGELYPCNSSAADIKSNVIHSQSHSCSCKPFMNRQHACCPTCIIKARD